ncbi:protein ripply1 isoform X1 [Canis lupus baileyi]|uniref:protein ripply1 isoform X1 n=1 Tax=Canis lupus dingo TaxID=286419 RepID=UPI0020C5B284|nr:protein ripply1 isoform X1 [Canis lupus dingo]
MQEVLRNKSPYDLPGLDPLRMDPSIPSAAAPGLLSPPLLVSSGQQERVFGGPGCPLQGTYHSGGGRKASRRGGSCLAMYFEPHASFCFGQATGGATGAKVIKAASEFHHPVRLFWPKSRSFDYLYSDGEILLQNFPIQATINLYEDSDDEEEEEEEEKEREEEKKLETDERGLGEHVRGPGSAPPRAIAHPLSPLVTGPN